jgi:tetratricopeptide (TPR) repeat protein
MERATAILQAVGASWFSAYVPLVYGQLRLRQGRWEETVHRLEEAIALAEPIGDTQALQIANWLLGELEVMEGRAQAARDRLQALVAEGGPYIVLLLMVLAWAYLTINDLDQAEEAARRALAIAPERHQRLFMPEVLRVQGMILTRQERWDEAKRTFEEAISLAQAMPHPYAEARALHEYGLMHGQKGEPDQMRLQLEQALAIFERLSAKKDVERTERALGALDRSADLTR